MSEIKPFPPVRLRLDGPPIALLWREGLGDGVAAGHPDSLACCGAIEPKDRIIVAELTARGRDGVLDGKVDARAEEERGFANRLGGVDGALVRGVAEELDREVDRDVLQRSSGHTIGLQAPISTCQLST